MSALPQQLSYEMDVLRTIGEAKTLEEFDQAYEAFMCSEPVQAHFRKGHHYIGEELATCAVCRSRSDFLRKRRTLVPVYPFPCDRPDAEDVAPDADSQSVLSIEERYWADVLNRRSPRRVQADDFIAHSNVFIGAVFVALIGTVYGICFFLKHYASFFTHSANHY
jgi:hypothetical protein